MAVLVVNCASQKELPLSEIDRPPGAIKEEGSPIFRHAETFDRYVRKTLSPAETNNFKSLCKTDPHPFCYSLEHWPTIESVIADKYRRYTPGETKPLTPIIPEIKNRKVSNWETLRKGKVQAILKGLLSLPTDQLNPLIAKARSEKRCPNNVAVALAATLEDYLPEGARPKELAALYAQGGRCARREPIDREHFYTRAGIFSYLAKDYPSAMKYLKIVRPQDVYLGRSLYWLFRTQQAVGKPQEAEQTARKLRFRHPFSFHTLLVARELGWDLLSEVPENAPPLRDRSQRNPKVNAVVEQLEILNKYGFDSSAAILADWALTRFPKIEGSLRMYIASMGDSHAKVIQIPELLSGPLLSRQTLRLAYPTPYFRFYERYGTQPYLGLAVSKKESTFVAHAISVANAQGIMQLNPETALQMTGGKERDLFNPEINIELGMRHLEDLLQQFQGKYPLVLASYNAGEGPVHNWIRRYGTNDWALWIDLIPYRETRDYVAMVSSYHYWYRRLYHSDSAKEALPY